MIKDGDIITDELDKATLSKEHFENWFRATEDDGTQVIRLCYM